MCLLMNPDQHRPRITWLFQDGIVYDMYKRSCYPESDVGVRLCVVCEVLTRCDEPRRELVMPKARRVEHQSAF